MPQTVKNIQQNGRKEARNIENGTASCNALLADALLTLMAYFIMRFLF